MTRIVVPILSHVELVAVQRVRSHFERFEPDFSGAVIQIEQNSDAVGPSVDGCDELKGCRLLVAVQDALRDLDDARVRQGLAWFEPPPAP